MSTLEASESLLKKYERMLADSGQFKLALERHADAVLSQEETSICGLLTLVDMVVDMLAECGLQNLKSLYTAVKKHASVHFDTCTTWQTCHLSGVNARGCMKVGDGVFVHRQHIKWVLSLWLCTHLREQERGRSSVPDADAAVYRAAMQCVLQQLHGAYLHVAEHLKKNNVLACALQNEPCANDHPR